MTDQRHDDWIDGLMQQAAHRAATTTPEQQEAHRLRVYRQMCARLDLPPFEAVDGKTE